tara:strand:- start:274 stop:720 length:447 start_codon:yes stop_codon:yes gene_type:complete
MKVIDYPNYHIFRNGKVLSEKSKKFIKPYINNNGYTIYNIYKNGKQKSLYTHRLLAIHFIPNPNNYPFVDHKDGNPLNNHVSNLRWCTNQMNQLYDNHKLQKNNKSGYRGISYSKKENKWMVRRKGIKSKRFNTLQEAIDYLNKFKTE